MRWSRRLVPRLVGFLSALDREFFDIFCSVDGVGARKALRAMVRPVRDLARTIQDQDVKLLSTFPGIGEATAERIVAKLRRKVGKFALIVGAEDAGRRGRRGKRRAGERRARRDSRHLCCPAVGRTFRGQARQAIDRVLSAQKEIQVRGRYDRSDLSSRANRQGIPPRSRNRGKAGDLFCLPHNRSGPIDARTDDQRGKRRRRRAQRVVAATTEASSELPRSLDPVDEKLRPQRLSEIIGQRAVAERLAISLAAARKRGEPLPHILFDGPPGLGKTTFATVLHNELGVELSITSGAALDKKMDVMPFLTNATEGSILFIDEIHRLPRAVEEFIYPVMEDFRVDVVLGEGMSARTINLPLKKFTIIGATTRSGMLSGPLRERFGMHEHLEFYDVDDLARIITINAAKLRSTIVAEAAWELAARSRGTPRIANARLRWVRDYALARADGHITLAVARDALDMQEIDSEGLDKQDRRYLETLIRVFGGGPTGVEALAATMNVSVDTLKDEVEPYLLRREFLVRSPRGRQVTPAAYRHLGLPAPPPEPDAAMFDSQRRLFD